jgi:O-antigen/teichoic acid export membrane protein
VLDAGLSTLLLRECSQIRAGELSRESQDREIVHLLHHALAVVLLLGIVVVVGSVGVGMALELGPQLALAQGAFMLYIALGAASSVLEAHMRSERRLKDVLAATMIEKVGLLACVVVVLVLGGNVLAVGLAYILGGTLRVWLDHRLSLRRLQKASRRVQFAVMHPLVRAAAPFVLNASALTFLPRIDTALVAIISVVGASYYGLGFQIVTTATLIPAIASITLIPLLVAHREARSARWRVFGLMTTGGLLAAAIGIVLAPPIVPLLFGSKYTAAVGSIQIMLLTLPFIFGSNAIMSYLYADGHEKGALRWLLLPSIAGTALVLLGQIALGPDGASAGLVGRYALITISFVGLATRATPSQPLKLPQTTRENR